MISFFHIVSCIALLTIHHICFSNCTAYKNNYTPLARPGYPARSGGNHFIAFLINMKFPIKNQEVWGCNIGVFREIEDGRQYGHNDWLHGVNTVLTITPAVLNACIEKIIV